MNAIPLVLYAAAAIVYAVHFAKRQPAIGRMATTLLLLAVLSHTFVIGMQTMEVRHVPFASRSHAISTFVWLLALSYIYLEVTTDERAMGVFILPIAVGLQMIPAFSPGIENADPVLDSPWFWVHVLSLMFAYASFALAGMLGLTYMLQFKEIKKKHLGYFYTRLPSLHVLDAMNSRAVDGRLAVSDDRRRGRRGLDGAGARARAGELQPAGDVARRSEDLHRAADVGGVLVRGVRALDDGMDRAPSGVALGGRASRSSC